MRNVYLCFLILLAFSLIFSFVHWLLLWACLLIKTGFFYNTTWSLRRGEILPKLEFLPWVLCFFLEFCAWVLVFSTIGVKTKSLNCQLNCVAWIAQTWRRLLFICASSLHLHNLVLISFISVYITTPIFAFYRIGVKPEEKSWTLKSCP